jgi:hypothetical protein
LVEEVERMVQLPMPLQLLKMVVLVVEEVATQGKQLEARELQGREATVAQEILAAPELEEVEEAALEATLCQLLQEELVDRRISGLLIVRSTEAVGEVMEV